MDPYTRLSDHFTFIESYQSQMAERASIDNVPSIEIVPTLFRTATMMEKVRSVCGNNVVRVSSWYRCPTLNHAVRGSITSQHMKGEAVDFTIQSFGDPLAICRQIIAHKNLIRFDQLILEHTWVHISQAATPNATQRGQVLSLLKTGGYAAGLTDKQGVPYGTA